jgi:hypothetical protein
MLPSRTFVHLRKNFNIKKYHNGESEKAFDGKLSGKKNGERLMGEIMVEE